MGVNGQFADYVRFLLAVLTKPPLPCILNYLIKYNYVIKIPHSRGVSGALYLQSAIAGVIFCPGCLFAELPLVSGVEVWVLRNGNP